MHGYGGRKRSVPIFALRRAGLWPHGYGVLSPAGVVCRQNLWHKAASSSRPEEDPRTCCCMTVTTRPYFDSSIRSVSVWFLFFLVSFIDAAALVFLCLSSNVWTILLVCWNFVCVCFFNMFLELVNTFYCLAVGTLPFFYQVFTFSSLWLPR